MENLSIEPIKQEAWYLQIKDQIVSSKRSIDKMPIAVILHMYKHKKFLCDTCGKELGRIDFSLDDHIAHLVNPLILWSCEECLVDDMKNHRVIAELDNFKSYDIR